jgi:hypothetical protein
MCICVGSCLCAVATSALVFAGCACYQSFLELERSFEYNDKNIVKFSQK